MDKKRRNYKLIFDPFLHRGQHQKVYRFDGINPVDNQLVEVKDPRPRIQRSWFRRQPADLPIPRFKYDCYYVGTPPAKEVTFSNLNDNVNKDFLENMCKTFGKVEECKIYYNPKTKKHMGVGKVVFTSSKAAKSCAEKLNQTSKMGNIMTVVIDTMGKERAKMIEDMLNERRVHHLQKSCNQDSGVHTAKNSLRRETFDAGENDFEIARRTTNFDFTPRSESGYSGSLSESGYSGPTPSSILSDHSHSVGKSSGHYSDSYKNTPYSAGNQFDPDYNSHHSVSQDFNYGMNNYGNHHNTVGPTYDDSGFTQMNPPKFDPTRPPPNHPDFLRRENEPPDRFFKDRDVHKPENSRSCSSSDYKEKTWHNDKHHWISNKLRDKVKDRAWDRNWDRGHDKDRGRDRYNNRDSSRETTDHSRNYERSNDYVRDNNSHDTEYSRDWEKEKPKVRNKVAKPKIAVEEPDDEPRSLSLESRIQSLLTGNDPDAELDSQTPKLSEEPSTLPPPSSNTWERSPQVPSKQVPQTPTSYDVNKNSPSWRASSGHLVHQTPIESPWPQTPHVPESPWPSQTPSVQTPSQASSDQWNSVDKPSFSYDSNFKPSPAAYSPQQGFKTQNNVQPETNDAPPAAADDDDDDDKMSISSISSGEEKLEVNSQIPTTSSQPTSLPNSFAQSVPMFNQGPVPSPWQQGGFVNQDGYPPTYNSFVGMNPFNQTFCNQYQNDMVNAQMVNAYGNQMGYEEEEKVPEIDEKLFNSSLNSFVKDLKEILQRDLCKKMVENSAFKSFEKWWDREEEKKKPPKLLGSQDKQEKPVPIKNVPPSAPQSAMNSTIASLFENRHPWSREGGLESSLGFGQGFGVGGLLGLRGAMPKMPSFKKKMRAPTPPQEEEGESQSNKSKVIDEEAESDHESDHVPRTRKPVVSESEEESEEEEEKAQSDDEEESSEEEEEESDEESDESSSEEDEEDDEEVDDNELVALQKDIDEETEGDESKSKVKVEVEAEAEESNDDIAKRKDEAKPLSPITEEAMEDEEVDVETDDTQDTSVTEAKSDAEASSQDKDAIPKVEESDTPSSSEVSDATSPTKDQKKKILPSSMAPELVDLIRKTIKDKKILREPKTSESELSADNIPPPVGNEEELSLQKDDESKKPYVNPAIAEHDYFAAPPVQDKSAGDSDATASADEESGGMPHEIWMDHNYCMPRAKFELSESELQDSAKKSVVRTNKIKARENTESDSTASVKDKLKEKPKRKYTKRKNKEEKLTDITHTLNRSVERGSRELANLLPPPKPKAKFSPRSFQEERQTFFSMYQNGIDNEDVGYLKRTYDELMQSDDPMFYWLNDILWVDHPVTNIPDPTPSRKRRKVDDMQYKTHKTGCSRTEGYYKLTMQEKAAYLLHARNVTLQQKVIESINKTIAEQAKKNVVSSRDARNENRRLQTALSDLPELGELLKFNQLKFRKKQLRFAKSSIHDWGLFALEPIAADEMVIEYCGQMVRQSVADLREKKYENTGIGSSYLFRVDGETIIDATKTGNLARFINHSCNPNCYAKIISVEGLKKIVIYSKRDIDVNEEITYDYKFPIEDEKIPCLCMAHGCRGTLN